MRKIYLEISQVNNYMVRRVILISLFPYILYLGVGYFIFDKPIEDVLFLSIFFLLGFVLLSIVINFIVFGKKQKLIIDDYTEGSGGNAAIGFIGRGKIYSFTYSINSNIYKDKLSYASLFSYEKGQIANGYKHNNLFVIGKDLIVLTYFGLMLLFPSLKLFG